MMFSIFSEYPSAPFWDSPDSYGMQKSELKWCLAH